MFKLTLLLCWIFCCNAVQSEDKPATAFWMLHQSTTENGGMVSVFEHIVKLDHVHKSNDGVRGFVHGSRKRRALTFTLWGNDWMRDPYMPDTINVVDNLCDLIQLYVNYIEAYPRIKGWRIPRIFKIRMNGYIGFPALDVSDCNIANLEAEIRDDLCFTHLSSDFQRSEKYPEGGNGKAHHKPLGETIFESEELSRPKENIWFGALFVLSFVGFFSAIGIFFGKWAND